jgi:hypothetical protein
MRQVEGDLSARGGQVLGGKALKNRRQEAAADSAHMNPAPSVRPSSRKRENSHRERNAARDHALPNRTPEADGWQVLSVAAPPPSMRLGAQVKDAARDSKRIADYSS